MHYQEPLTLSKGLLSLTTKLIIRFQLIWLYSKRFLSLKGADPTYAAKDLENVEVHSDAGPQEEFESINLEDSLQHAHDMVVLSAIEEANQLVCLWELLRSLLLDSLF